MSTSSRFDAVIIGSGLGGLTAGALLAKAGYSVCLLERNTSLGGAASCYRVGTLTIEAALHETADPRNPREVKHGILKRLDLLDKLTWLPVGGLYTVQGGPIGEPLSLPHGFEQAREVLTKRFPRFKRPVERVLGKMERICDIAARLNAARESHSLGRFLAALPRLYPIVSGWRASLDDVFSAEFGENEAVKFGLAANLPYYSTDPKRLWWLFYAVAQGGYIGNGGVYVRGGSRQLSVKLGGVIKKAGGTVLLGTAATSIEVNGAGAAIAVQAAARGDRPSQRIEAGVLLANCAPDAIAGMLPEGAGRRFAAAFRGLAPSTSLFSAHFGLKTNPAQFGLTAYSTILLPSWMNALGDYRHAAALLGTNPAGRMPPLTIANYGAIEAGIDDGGPILVSVVGADEISNWRGLSKGDEAARRNAWLDAILAELERHYPGFGGAVTEKVFVSAASMERYLGTPGGAVYGFDPVPPKAPIWAGMPRSPKTPLKRLYLASAFGGSGGFSGAMAAGAEAAELASAVLQSKN
ncbi:MAG: NAD(P)/FAD-dependent oxidoreductase [Rhodomicrobium sp.]|nr:NAD(P)/FAD-dependent oxidoreductase [Rhodomicrobium sp.]